MALEVHLTSSVGMVSGEMQSEVRGTLSMADGTDGGEIAATVTRFPLNFSAASVFLDVEHERYRVSVDATKNLGQAEGTIKEGQWGYSV